ncbi:putative SWI/SNF-related matrix-associated actin-dependent regulator, partial [Mucuna pruriens]
MDSEEDERSCETSAPDKYLLGFVMANIVGLQHHCGTILGRALVGLVREPHNPHDPNAIQVFNTHSLPVGYIERSVAAALSPLIDADLITVEAIVPNARKTHRIPCQIHIFARFQDFNAVKDSGLKIITESDAAFTLSDAVAVKETRAQKKSTSVDTIFRNVDHDLARKNRVIQTLEPPKSIIKSELLPHQKEALAWLVHRENSDELPPFWEENDGKFVNILTNYQTDERPNPLRGGILADEMGLGKTLTLLSLIAFDKKSQMGVSKKWRTDRKAITFERPRKKEGESTFAGMRTNATLVVCPPSVISTWITQLEEHTVPGALKTYMYYGDRRTENAEELKMYDLVLTTYSTLCNEQPIPDLPAKKMEWRRIVLDEAHAIKNIKAQQSEAVCRFHAQYRWAVTGTPVQSGCIDLFSIMVFLRFEPFSVRSYWRELVQRPLNKGTSSGVQRLQVLMDAIALRRTKDVALVGLPPKTTETCYVELSLEERELYDQVKAQTKTLLNSFNHEDNIMVPCYPAVLSRILRLRQICTDLKLCEDQSLLLTNIEDVSNNPELKQTLLELLEDEEEFDCPVCLSPPTDIVITRCTHIFCRECILRALKNSNSRCPLCRHTLSESDLFSAPSESSKAEKDEACSSTETGLSSKACTLMKLLIESRNQNPATKSVVFSQFRKVLVLLEGPLNAAGFKTLRLDGTMNARQRAKVIEQFQDQGREGATVLLASIRASSAGINLTSASRLYFMEPWWNHAVEEQAMDRVHRIGQKEAVKVVRLIARNSIEEKILILQEKKKQLCAEPGTRLYGRGMQDIRFLLDD